MIIKLVRHGRSVGNDDGSQYITTPDHDIVLSQEGIQQAKAVAHHEDMFELYRGELLADVYTSPFIRARETLGLCFKEMDIEPKRIKIDHRLREQSWGRPISEEEHSAFISLHFNNKYYGKNAISESGAMMIDRVHSFVDRIEEREEDCLIFTHGATINAFKAIIKGYTVEAFENMGYVRNCEITTLEL